MRKASIIYFIILIVGILITGCKKKEDDPILGCTDKNASNYNPKAETSNGKCEYNGYFLIHWNESVSDSLIADGVDSLRLIVNYYFVSNYQTALFNETDPECEGEDQKWKVPYGVNPVTGYIPLYDLRIMDDKGKTLYSGATPEDLYNLQLNICHRIRIDYPSAP